MLLNNKVEETIPLTLADIVSLEERKAVGSRFGISLCKTSFGSSVRDRLYGLDFNPETGISIISFFL